MFDGDARCAREAALESQLRRVARLSVQRKQDLQQRPRHQPQSQRQRTKHKYKFARVDYVGRSAGARAIARDKRESVFGQRRHDLLVFADHNLANLSIKPVVTRTVIVFDSIRFGRRLRLMCEHEVH